MIEVVWFKRDLRVVDHKALFEACKNGTVLPIFVWEPSVWSGEDYAMQHACFVRECLHDLAEQLKKIGLTLHVFHKPICAVLNQLTLSFNIHHLYSHQETGNLATYEVDQTVKTWCSAHQIIWFEYPQNGVVRVLKNRDTWAKNWALHHEVDRVQIPQHATGLTIQHDGLNHLPNVKGIDKPKRQQGGRQAALSVLKDFITVRSQHYRFGISSPNTAVSACSRLSPHLAWGTISTRETVQKSRQYKTRYATNTEYQHHSQGLNAFLSRLYWHCHFMQKLESQPSIEYASYYHGFDELHTKNEAYHDRLEAWQQGRTGWPLVDACMRMLKQTGWLNFRMRALVVSSASYLLWLPWRPVGLYLANEFLDYEPGIHWPQIQMQSGTTGINTLRIYNPTKQAQQHDKTGLFIKKWLPELRKVPLTWLFEPWRMPTNLQHQYGCLIDVDYPSPLVDINTAMREAKVNIYQVRHEMQQSGVTKMIVKQHASRKPLVKRKVTQRKKHVLSLETLQGDLFSHSIK